MVLTLRPHKVNGINVRVVNWNSMHDPSATPCVCVCVCVWATCLSLTDTAFSERFCQALISSCERDEEKMKREGRVGAGALRKQVNRLAFFFFFLQSLSFVYQ